MAQATKDTQVKDEYNTLKSLNHLLSEGYSAREFKVQNENQKQLLKNLHLISNKPIIYVCNVHEDDAQSGNLWTEKVFDFAKSKKERSLIISGAIEEELSQLEKTEQMDFLKHLGLNEMGLHRLINESYKLLKLRTYFTAGQKEVRAWTITEGTFAPQAAGCDSFRF